MKPKPAPHLGSTLPVSPLTDTGGTFPWLQGKVPGQSSCQLLTNENTRNKYDEPGLGAWFSV